MFFFLSKALHFLISPLVWILFILAYTIFTKHEKRRKKLLIVAFSVLYIFSTPAFHNALLSTWEVKATKPTETFDVAIVLLGFTSLNQTPTDRIHVSQAVNRITQLMPLYRSGQVKKILLTGGSSSTEPMHKAEAIETQKLLMQWGVNEEDLLIEPNARNTYENLLYAKELLANKNISGKLLLVSSGYHLKRGTAIAEKLGLPVTPYATDFRELKTDSWLQAITPSTNAFLGLEKIIHEWVGYVTYKLKGYC